MGKYAKNGLKTQEKAHFIGFKKEEKRGNQLKRGTLTPLEIKFMNAIWLTLIINITIS